MVKDRHMKAVKFNNCTTVFKIANLTFAFDITENGIAIEIFLVDTSCLFIKFNYLIFFVPSKPL